ncbi:NAD(P)H-dependent glycerol-3-phosphate dehydrogenase [candidate division NPL-UPA2 bacterium]|nr:NAD(P)H-dependent glycerol-3-phosphate dehydrogenase [candidate division NPL-UPA2 bacterium]
MSERIAILGAGSWGCTLAWHLNKKGILVRLWDLESQVKLLKKRRRCLKIPKVRIPSRIEITPCLDEATDGAQIIFIALPSQVVRKVIRKLKNFARDQIIVSASKGIENKTLMRISEVIIDVLGRRSVAVLSGPSHAEEVCRRIPTTIVAASQDGKAARRIQQLFMTETLRVYTNPDIIGVELGGALKNPIAIAAGISDGLGFGDNTKAALLTRGLAEITRLGIVMGARRETFAGLSGMGDLITTCISRHSRNRNLGEAIGQGKTLKQALKRIGMVVEGVPTTKSARGLARKYGVEMPITEQIHQVLFQGKDPYRAVADLMLREAKPEL